MTTEALIALIMALVQAVMTLAKDIPELIQIATNIRDSIVAAQASGQDITVDQLNKMRADIDVVMAQLNAT